VAIGIRAVMAGQQAEFHLEYPCHSSQERRWFVVRVTRFAGDRPVRVVVAHENITERKLAEGSMRESEEKFRQITETINEVFWITDPSMHELIYVSPAYEKIWGRTCASLYATPRQWLEVIHPEDGGRVAQAAAAILTSGSYDATYRILRPDKTERWIHDKGFPVRSAAGEIYRIVGTAEDITEKRKLEDAYRQAQKMESIGQLAGGIAHDFNNILGAIVGNLYLAKLDAAEHPALLAHLENISEASQRATDLVSQILTFSRQGKPEREPLKLNHVVLEVLKLLRASLPAGIRIQIELAEAPAVLANATAIHQVIMNLGTNAWHAMRDQNGVLKVEMNVLEVDEDFTRTRPDLHPGSYVQISVSDTGCGMDRHTLEHVFEPFFTTKAVGEGTGLGLAVVHGIMKSHDGGVSVYSQPGKGTRFNLYFPVIAAEVTVREIEAAPIPRGHGEHILFVDDEEPLVSAGKKMLERLGYVVTAKASPLEAITLVRDQPAAFDLVITDLTMPGLDGVALGRRLHQIQPQLAIILTTGYSGLMTAKKIRELGFRELLDKPCTARVLAETVERVLHPAAAIEK
jgi:PAS domain S-box-containing protein